MKPSTIAAFIGGALIGYMGFNSFPDHPIAVLASGFLWGVFCGVVGRHTDGEKTDNP